MKTQTNLAAALFLMSSLGLVSISSANDNRTLVFALKGTAVGEPRSLPTTADTGTKEGNCFDVVVTDMLRGETVGSGSRCFTDVKHVGDGMALTDTVILNLPQGKLVSQDRITIQPVLHGPSDITHIAGAAPSAYSNNIVGKASTEAFSGATGRLRLASGMNMARFEEKNEITFDDFTVIELIDPRDDIRRVQIQLKNLGFYGGNIDGIPGPRTTAALRDYQAKHGLPTTGELDEPTSKSLGSQ